MRMPQYLEKDPFLAKNPSTYPSEILECLKLELEKQEVLFLNLKHELHNEILQKMNLETEGNRALEIKQEQKQKEQEQIELASYAYETMAQALDLIIDKSKSTSLFNTRYGSFWDVRYKKLSDKDITILQTCHKVCGSLLEQKETISQKISETVKLDYQISTAKIWWRRLKLLFYTALSIAITFVAMVLLFTP